MDNNDDRLLVPYDETRRKLGDIGRTSLYQLFETRELTRVHIGRRGFVTAAAYVDRLSDAASA